MSPPRPCSSALGSPSPSSAQKTSKPRKSSQIPPNRPILTQNHPKPARFAPKPLKTSHFDPFLAFFYRRASGVRSVRVGPCFVRVGPCGCSLPPPPVLRLFTFVILNPAFRPQKHRFFAPFCPFPPVLACFCPFWGKFASSAGSKAPKASVVSRVSRVEKIRRFSPIFAVFPLFGRFFRHFRPFFAHFVKITPFPPLFTAAPAASAASVSVRVSSVSVRVAVPTASAPLRPRAHTSHLSHLSHPPKPPQTGHFCPKPPKNTQNSPFSPNFTPKTPFSAPNTRCFSSLSPSPKVGACPPRAERIAEPSAPWPRHGVEKMVLLLAGSLSPQFWAFFAACGLRGRKARHPTSRDVRSVGSD